MTLKSFDQLCSEARAARTLAALAEALRETRFNADVHNLTLTMHLDLEDILRSRALDLGWDTTCAGLINPATKERIDL